MNVTSFNDNLGRLLNKPYMGFLLSLAALTILFLPIFYSDYAFLDEAHQLWHNRDGSDYSMFLVQGRWLTGLIFSRSFAELSAISGIKILRILSFFSWALFIEEFFRLGEKWRQRIVFDRSLLTLGGIYIACSLSLAIYIGWASCFEVGLASLLGLWSGHLFFTLLGDKLHGEPGKDSRAPMHISILSLAIRILLILATTLGALFMYQVAFALFLLPAACHLIAKKSAASTRLILAGIGAYLALSILYYLLFYISLKQGSAVAADRTSISMDFGGKLGFFFSAPLSQAFCLNFLYNMHSVVSQAFPILVMAGWVIAYMITDRNSPGKKISFVVLFVVFSMFLYLPVLVAKENFASYRTMFVLNLTVSLLVIDALLNLFRAKRTGYIALTALLCCFIAVGFRNFRYNFLDPLKKEYQWVANDFNTRYDTAVRTIYFLRPAEDLFYPDFHIHPFKDEFGVPSTFKDWTPEPLMKQFILERTNSRSLADSTRLIQFTDRTVFDTETKNPHPHALYIDVEGLFNVHPQ